LYGGRDDGALVPRARTFGPSGRRRPPFRASSPLNRAHLASPFHRNRTSRLSKPHRAGKGHIFNVHFSALSRFASRAPLSEVRPTDRCPFQTRACWSKTMRLFRLVIIASVTPARAPRGILSFHPCSVPWR